MIKMEKIKQKLKNQPLIHYFLLNPFKFKES